MADALWLAADPTVFKFVVFELWFSFMYACYSSVQVAAMVELVPAHARTAGYSFAQAVAAAVLRPDAGNLYRLTTPLTVMRWWVSGLDLTPY